MMKEMKYLKISLIAIFAFVAIIATAQSKHETFRLGSLLQRNMVIQQKKPFTLWGKAEPGSVVSVKTSWNATAKTTTLNDSTWKLQVKVPAAKAGDFTKQSITISNNQKVVTLENVLIGEVWLCSGQSNMDMSMQPALPWHKGVTNNKEEIAAANYPNIRLFKVTKETSTVVRDTLQGTWQECSPATVADFSGVAYYFGRRLYNQLSIPIGLVQSAYGSAACQAFIKREVLAADTVLKHRYLDPYDANPNDKIPVLRPMLIYNAMIHPLTNLSIKGFLWYQGESNGGEVRLYPRLNEAMIKSWRDEFGQGKLPFYYVQMTPYNMKKGPAVENGYARFREAQQKILEVKNTGMVCTMDVGEPENIHPNNKEPVGERLAALALYNDYNKKSTIHLGPCFKSFTTDGNIVKVKFAKASLDGGLNTNDGESPKHFFVSGSDKVFYPAKGKIVNDEVWLESEQVKQPVAVRYAFTNYPVTNLQNKAGFPVYPFRTDNWDDEKIIDTEKGK